MTYQRSAVLILLKAIYEVIGKDRLKKVAVDFSIGNGLFMEPIGEFEVTTEMAEKIRDQMRAYVNASIPIMKRSMNTDEAVELFHQHKMYDKERLFHYRRVSRVNIYSIGKFEDYNYGYMVQNTGYIQYFDVIAYRRGLCFYFRFLQSDQDSRISATGEALLCPERGEGLGKKPEDSDGRIVK